MLKEKIDSLLSTLDTNVSTIAAYADTDVTNFSRLKSGARVPKSNSKTIDHLIDGVLKYAASQEKTDLLDQLTGYPAVDSAAESRKEHLRGWLFPHAFTDSGPTDAATYAQRLDTVIRLSGITNRKLAVMTNTDASYISRIRNGKRSLYANPALSDAIARALFHEIALRSRMGELKELLGLDEAVSDEECYQEYNVWLSDFSVWQSQIRVLLETINHIQLPPVWSGKVDRSASVAGGDVHADAEKDTGFEKDASDGVQPGVYFGEKGLQDAAIRFLEESLAGRSREIFLYSDQGIGWMTADRSFAEKWMILMQQLLLRGIRIHIIHHIDRSISDMVKAIQSWLPLYMTGTIEPYYSTIPVGRRFSHTLFICPDAACVSGFGLRDHKDTILHYNTEKEQIEQYLHMFREMRKQCRPLLLVERVTFDETAGIAADRTSSKAEEETGMQISIPAFDQICIALEPAAVTITRIREPQVSFKITNPQLCHAIRAYCGEAGVE